MKGYRIMTDTKMMELPTKSPAYLTAQADLKDARTDLRRLSGVPAGMVSRNADHAAEVAEKSRTGAGPLITNGQALRRGTGSGFEIVYRRCSCDGFEPECFHDPTESPYTAADIAKAEKAVKAAEKAVAEYAATLAETPAAFDAFANAREAGAMYVWWPQDIHRDPRKFHYRGQPLTADELTNLGPHSLRRAITNGAVIEVPQ
jgi:hypothetical protein